MQSVQRGPIEPNHLDELFTRPLARDQADSRPAHAQRVGHRVDQRPIGCALHGACRNPNMQDGAIPDRARPGGAWMSPNHQPHK
jgi:hypothetical protein